jgi:hypothetical protein
MSKLVGSKEKTVEKSRFIFLDCLKFWSYHAQRNIKRADKWIVILLYIMLLLGNILFFYDLQIGKILWSINDIFFIILGMFFIICFCIHNFLLFKNTNF